MRARDACGSFQKVYERSDMGSWEVRARKARSVLQAGGLMARIMATGAQAGSRGAATADPEATGAVGDGRSATVEGTSSAVDDARSVGDPGRGGWGAVAVQPGVPCARHLALWARRRGVRVLDSVHDPYATLVLADRQVCGDSVSVCKRVSILQPRTV